MRQERNSTPLNVARHHLLRLVALLALAAWQPAPGAEATVSVTPSASTAGPPAVLVVANREIVTFRVEVTGATPAERVEGVGQRIAAVLEQGGPLDVSTREIPGRGVAILIDGNFVFRVLNEDTDVEIGETAQAAAARAARNLQLALDEVQEARDSAAMLRATGESVLATVLLAGALWLLVRAHRWLAGLIGGFATRRAARLAGTWGEQTIGQMGIVRLVMMPLRLLTTIVAVLLVYEWLAVVLNRFPYTRPWGESLFENLRGTAGEISMNVLEALPGLLFVVLIVLVARFFVRVLKAYVAGVQEGRIQSRWIDEATARPTGRVIAAAIWLLALVAAYPYIPGSGSEAFKGIGVLAGLMLSLGSSGVVNQAVSGLMIMYTRSLRPGEFVKIGETEGIVREVGFMTTHIETIRREQVTIPNAVVVSNVMRNFSRLKEGGGARLATAVTIGYDVPWRQVQGMLQLAAERSANVERDPPPRVLQTALLDHAVEYTLLVCTADPTRRATVLSELHANIQDVFNENGVQIMSPVYEADPVQPKVVPPAEWFRPPAPPPP